MAFIDVFKVETEHRSIYGVPSRDDKSTKMFILEYIITKVPDNTSEKSKLIYLYGKYNIGSNVTEQSSTGTIGPPVPNPSPFSYLKLDGSNSMASDYEPINPKHVITLDYFTANGAGVTLGETDTTAYRGDRGAIAYDHSQEPHAPSTAEANREITDDLNITSSIISASATAVKLLNDNKSSTSHNHDLEYEPINSNIQTHISDGSIHKENLEEMLDVPPYSGNQGKILKVNATEDGTIWGDPTGATVSWGDVSGTIGLQTDLIALLDAKADTSQVLTNVPSGAVFTDTIYDSTDVDAHIADISTNPHSVSAADVNLENADNTSDLNKPVSTATQTALDLKENSLGNPTIDGFSLKSTVAGVRSWSNPLELVEVPAIDSYSGTTVTMTAGVTVTRGDLLYVQSDGKLGLANSSIANAHPVIAIALESVAADASIQVLLLGIIHEDGWSLTTGQVVYLAETNGAITQIAPNVLGSLIQIIGVALSSDRILFNPSMADKVSEVVDITPPDQLTILSITEL